MAANQRYTLMSSWLKHGRRVIGFWRERGLSEGWKTFRQLKEVQVGELKGVDRFGNQYWEDPAAVTGRNRYVVYPNRKTVNASTVGADWHAWLHYMQDATPVERPPQPLQFRLAHSPTVLSQQGAAATHLPSGHILSEKFTTYGSTGNNASEKLSGTYEAWKSTAQQANPEQAPKWATKTERR